MLDVADTLAIHQLLALYGHLIDERQWSRLDEVFTDDLVFDATDFGLGITHSLDELREAWTGPKAAHPLGHHVREQHAIRGSGIHQEGEREPAPIMVRLADPRLESRWRDCVHGPARAAPAQTGRLRQRTRPE